jgi:hypothetical protein
VEEMEITITPDGIIIDAKGYQGKTCLVELEKLIKHLEESGIHIDGKEQRLKEAARERSGSVNRAERSGN